MESNNDWLSELKEGDDVIVVSSSGGIRKKVATVTRTTKTQIIVGNSRYRKNNGYIIGSSCWCREYLMKPTPELIETLNAEEIKIRYVNFLKNVVDWGILDIEKLKKIYQIIQCENE